MTPKALFATNTAPLSTSYGLLLLRVASVPHVELVALYILIFATLLFTGPGRFSVDARLEKK